MGAGMAHNLYRKFAFDSFLVHDISAITTEKFIQKTQDSHKCRPAKSLEHLAKESNVIVTMLPESVRFLSITPN